MGDEDRCGHDGRFRVLFVCTGNVCRSPAAELLTRHLLKGCLGGRDAARFEVSSAGVRAVIGAPVYPETRSQLANWGLEGDHSGAFRARQLDEGVVRGVDLVLGATPQHRSSVLERHPELLAVTFALREFARLSTTVSPEVLPSEPVERARTLVREARRRRGALPAGCDDRIPDPMGGPPQAHEFATALTFEAVRTVVRQLTPRSAAS